MGLTAFTLDALIKLDDSSFKSGLAKAESSCKGLGDKIEKFGNGLKKVGKVALATIGTASVAVGKLALDSVKAYSEYEQLVGGVETLFGTSAQTIQEYNKMVGITQKSSVKEMEASYEKFQSLKRAEQTVLDNAHTAYKRAGVDANTYMATVTSFSASLLQSLKGDTEKSAEIADMAMVDMADNANKMGTDITSIQNAYQGFAKQNFTMLDNLKLGYGGTRSEMQRLLKDAEKIQKQQGKNVKYSINNLSDIYEAIHVIQDEMGITGTTAKEAENTIQGSTAMMKAAWMNLKIAMVDPNADIGQAINDMIDSAKIALKNWSPAVKQALVGIGTVIGELAPVISNELPDLLTDIMPGLVDAGVAICVALANALIENAPIIIDGFGRIFQAVGESLIESDSPIVSAIGKALKFIGDLIRDPQGTLARAWDKIKEIGAQVWDSIKEVATTAWDAVSEWWGNIVAKVSHAWDEVARWFDENVWQPIKNYYEAVWGVVSALWGSITSSISHAWSEVARWFDENVWQPIKEFFDPIWTAISGLWGSITGSLIHAWGEVARWFDENVWQPIKTFFQPVIDLISQLWGDISGSVSSAWSTVESILEPIFSALEKIFTPVVGLVTSIWEGIKGIFDYDGRTANINVRVNEVADKYGIDPDEITEQMFEEEGLVPTAGWFGNAKGNWSIPYDNYPALLHRNEMVLTASQARRYRGGDGAGIDLGALTGAIVSAVRQGMDGAQVNSYLDGRKVTDEVSRILGNSVQARRFAGA